MRIALAEDVARDDEQVIFNRAAHELVAGALGDFWKNIKRAARFHQFITRDKPSTIMLRLRR